MKGVTGVSKQRHANNIYTWN